VCVAVVLLDDEFASVRVIAWSNDWL